MRKLKRRAGGRDSELLRMTPCAQCQAPVASEYEHVICEACVAVVDDIFWRALHGGAHLPEAERLTP